ncbi:MAG TPA: hypothetical protein VJZ72_05085 [Candidatus Limnocylindrales bacterium]|nr:hypothetical protein [Candidatus Limnocylindrales bacterium]
MPGELFVTLLLVAAILILADFLLVGGAMTMTGMTAMGAVASHPLGLLALVVLVVLLIGRVL